jgi:gamma-glutamyltranspeptidase/glutathione hydrolase
LSADTRQALEARGHRFAPNPTNMSDLQGVMIEEKTNVRLGASDSRQDGAAVGY